MAVALLGCMRWEPLSSEALRATGTRLALERVRVADERGSRELTVREVRGSTLLGWDAQGAPLREELNSLRRVWVRRPDELLSAAVISGIYALIFAVSAAGLIIERP